MNLRRHGSDDLTFAIAVGCAGGVLFAFIIAIVIVAYHAWS